MTGIDLSQTEAEALIKTEKVRVDETRYWLPIPGESLEIPIQSIDGEENFLLDVIRGRIALKGTWKGSCQTRARQVIILLRLCFGGQPHRNPDGAEISSPHIHIYREGYGDKWAYPLPEFHWSLKTQGDALESFMAYCNVTKPPLIERRLLEW